MSKEEEMQPASNIRVNTHARGVVNAAAGQDTRSTLSLEKLREEIKKIAARLEELYQVLHSKEWNRPQQSCLKNSH